MTEDEFNRWLEETLHEPHGAAYGEFLQELAPGPVELPGPSKLGHVPLWALPNDRTNRAGSRALSKAAIRFKVSVLIEGCTWGFVMSSQ